MKISGPLGAIVGAVALFLTPADVTPAGRYDGSVPLLCSPVVVSECSMEGECRRVTADSVNLPQFLKVDVKGKKVYSEETGRALPIAAIETISGGVVLQGAQDGRGWTMTISETTGKMSSAISSGGEGWIVFGDCIVLP